MLITFSDAGVPYEEKDFTCDCTMQPSDGEMADFEGDEIDGGDWILRIDDIASEETGTLDEWCLDFSSDDVDAPEFIRGDANANGSVSALSDARFLLLYGFASGDEPRGAIGVLADALELLNYGFNSGDEPPAPFPDCGPIDDDDEDDLGCEEPAATGFCV